MAGPIDLADFNRVRKFVASALVANPEDMSFAVASLADQEKYSPEHIDAAILYADLEIIKFIQSTVGDGRRLKYGSYIDLLSGNSLPSHPGKIGIVEIRKTADTPFFRGQRTESLEALNKLLENPDGRYGSAIVNGGRYYIGEEMRLWFTGFACRIFIPDVLGITGTLQGPIDEEPAIVRGAMTMLAKDPLDMNLFGYWAPKWQADETRIRSLGGPAPVLDSYVLAGG